VLASFEDAEKNTAVASAGSKKSEGCISDSSVVDRPIMSELTDTHIDGFAHELERPTYLELGRRR